MLINLDKLKISRPALFRKVAHQLGCTGDPFELVLGTRELTDDEIDLDVRRLLKIWISADKTLSPPAVEEPALEPFASEEELLQRATDQAKGFARLQQFSDEQGLEESPANCSLVDIWLTEHSLLWSADNVDKAVLSLQNSLTWKPKEAPAPPPPPDPEPVEVLQMLSDGTKQLPLNVDNATLRRASKDQAFDWLKRTNAAKLIRPRGSFGSTL